jgi:catechol 2,3-dioxygenase-like lactoylglutathione lyase family enzyme
MRGALITGNLVYVPANHRIDTDRFAAGHAGRWADLESELSTMGTDTLELIADAIRIFVDDAAAAQTFYRELLGLPLHGGSPDQGYLVFGIGGVRLVVEAADSNDDESVSLVGRLVGLSFRVRDIQRAYRELESRGVVFAGAPERQPWGGTLAHFYDCSRNVLTLVEHPAA